MKCLKHLSVAECVISFLQKGLPGSGMLGHVDCMGVPDVASVHPRLTNVV